MTIRPLVIMAIAGGASTIFARNGMIPTAGLPSWSILPMAGPAIPGSPPMTEQSCKSCDYFTMEDESASHGHGWCWWATRHPVPYCFPQAEWDTWSSYGEACPCWRTNGHIETFLAEARARRQ